MNANERYLEAKVMSASPVELVAMLYRRAIVAVGAARRRLAEGDIRGRSGEISTAMEVIVELAGSLDREKGGELAGRLASVYDYMGDRLLYANMHQDDGALAEVERLLGTLEEGWAGVCKASSEPADPPALEAEEIPVACASSVYGCSAPPPSGAHCWSA